MHDYEGCMTLHTSPELYVFVRSSLLRNRMWGAGGESRRNTCITGDAHYHTHSVIPGIMAAGDCPRLESRG